MFCTLLALEELQILWLQRMLGDPTTISKRPSKDLALLLKLPVEAWLLFLAWTQLGGKGFSSEQSQLAPETRRDHSSGFSYHFMPNGNCYYAWCSLPPLHLHYSIVIGTHIVETIYILPT